MRVGFILLEKKKPRVLTPALSAAAAQHGIQLLVLDPCTPSQWDAEELDAIVHKVPEDSGLDARLLAYQQQHPATVLLDPPAAVQAVQNRALMLAPVTGTPLKLTNVQPTTEQQHKHEQQPGQQVLIVINTPAQVSLPANCTLSDAEQLLAAAGITYPALIKPLVSAPQDSAAADITAVSRGSDSGPCTRVSAAAAPHGRRDGHALGALLSFAGLHQLVSGACDPALQLPVVVQQFVPHGQALYKLYVIGPHVILTRRSTLTLQQIKAAAADKVASSTPGVVMLDRISAVPLQPPAAATPAFPSPIIPSGTLTHQQEIAPQVTYQQHSQQQDPPDQVQHPQQTAIAAHPSSTDVQKAVLNAQQQQLHAIDSIFPATSAGICPRPSGVAVCDSSVIGDDSAPPLWAMQQLAAYMRRQSGLNLFNIDIIAPEEQVHQNHTTSEQQFMSGQHHGVSSKVDLQAATSSGCVERTFLVVDVNFFPGFDKVPEAEQLFAEYLSSLRPDLKFVPVGMTNS